MPRPSRRLLPVALVLLGLLLLTSCGRLVRANAYLDSARAGTLFPGASFHLLSENRLGNPLLDREVAAKVGLLLTNAGYRLADPQHAEYLMGYSFGQSASSGTEYVARTEPGRRVQVTQTDRDGKTRTTYVDEPDRTYYVPQMVTNTTSRLRLVAYVNQNKGQPERALAVWSVDVETSASAGGMERDNLRQALNYLIVGGFSVLGQNTPQPVSFLVKDDDPRLQLIMGAR